MFFSRKNDFKWNYFRVQKWAPLAEDRTKMEVIYETIKVCLSEVVATCIFVTLACSSLAVSPDSHFSGCIGFGAGVAVGAWLVFHISGGHVNPAVSLCVYLNGEMPVYLLLLYIAAQCIGSICGAALFHLFLYDFVGISSGNKFCVTLPAPEISYVKVFAWEFILTAILILIVCSILDPRTNENRDAFIIKVFFVIEIVAYVGGKFCGTSLNPARSLGPALIAWNWEAHWLYWIAPLTSSAFTSIFYVLFLKSPPPTSVEEKG